MYAARMRLILFLSALLVVSGTARAQSVPAAAQGIEIACPNDGSSVQEKALLKTSPHGATRIGKHTLQVKLAHGVKTFIEKKPYNIGEIGGINWEYCGYNAVVKMHLIYKNDGDVEKTGGVLLDDATGRLLPAGYTVALSADELYYAARYQPGGQDGDSLVVYDRKTGVVLWQSYGGAISGKDGNIVAQFDNYRWSGDILLADATMLADETAAAQPGSPKPKTRLVTLSRQANGKWAWSPDLAKK